MDNQITIDYFRGALSLPTINLKGRSTLGQASVISDEQAEIERYIAIYQKEYLTKMFGSEIIPDEVAAMVNDTTLFVSPIANYVFFKVLPTYQSRSTVSGERVKTGEGSAVTEYTEKAYLIWNEMVDKNIAIREALYNEGLDTTYPTRYTVDIYARKSFLG
jgi:hypothetical protein